MTSLQVIKAVFAACVIAMLFVIQPELVDQEQNMV